MVILSILKLNIIKIDLDSTRIQIILGHSAIPFYIKNVGSK